MIATNGPEPSATQQQKTEAFVGKVLADTAGLTTTVLAAFGDRLGLFKDLAAAGPATDVELAARTGIDARYAREWLCGMTAAGYLRHDAASSRFTLPPEHVPVLAEEAGPVFFGGTHSVLLSELGAIDRIEAAFRSGSGVPQSGYPESTFHHLDRFTAGWFEHLLLDTWIPAVPHVKARLEAGITVADVGCGQGRALVKLAGAFPRSRFVGYDIHGPSLERAAARAREAGVADRVRFVQTDAAKVLPERYDLVTTFDVVHDAADPRGLLRAIRTALTPGGTYLCLEINCSDRLEENAGPLAALLYGASVLYCMTTSLGHGGEGLGTMGLPPRTLEALAREAGFSSTRRLPLENPFNNLFEIRP